MASEFGEILKRLREEKNLKQSDLGAILNVANNTISSWERGNSEPNLEQLRQLAKFFNVTADYLLGLED